MWQFWKGLRTAGFEVLGAGWTKHGSGTLLLPWGAGWVMGMSRFPIQVHISKAADGFGMGWSIRGIVKVPNIPESVAAECWHTWCFWQKAPRNKASQRNSTDIHLGLEMIQKGLVSHCEQTNTLFLESWASARASLGSPGYPGCAGPESYVKRLGKDELGVQMCLWPAEGREPWECWRPVRICQIQCSGKDWGGTTMHGGERFKCPHAGVWEEKITEKSQNHGMGLLGREFKDHPVPAPPMGRDTFH